MTPGHSPSTAPAFAPNQTGLPDPLKAGIESLSGVTLDAVRVHRNSSRPAQLNALAFARGSEIHLAPGQERHLPHEAWHVVQQAQGRVRPTMHLRGSPSKGGGVPVNDDPSLEREADLMGALAPRAANVAATSPRGAVRPSAKTAQTVQRVIAGLAKYENPEKIPSTWVDAYRQDLLHEHTHLTNMDILSLYEQVRGTTPDEEGVQFDNPNGNHWDVTIKGVSYRIRPDGSCALHGVDLVDRVLRNAETINPNTPYFAPENRVQELRRMVQERHGPEEAVAEIRNEIADRISKSDYVFETGLGPELSILMNGAIVMQNKEGRSSLFYVHYEELPLKFWSLPKPSVAKAELNKIGFFDKDFRSHEEMIRRGISILYEKNNFGIAINFGEKTYKEKLLSGRKKALSTFSSEEKASEEFGKFRSDIQENRRLKKRSLEGDRFISEEQSQLLRLKLEKTRFRNKLFKSSHSAIKKLKSPEGDDSGPKKIFDIVSGGKRDLSTNKLSSIHKYSAITSFSKSKNSSKRDLQFSLGESSEKSSIGKGGLQVKGVGRYTQEILWFSRNIQKWKVSWETLMQAMQDKDFKRLKEITGNEKTAARLLRFEDLQLLERWRGEYFSVGVSAHARLGYHGQQTMPDYLRSMPMREEGATTNVSNTKSLDQPHDKQMWERQEKDTIDGILKLSEVKVEKGKIYDQRTVNYLRALAEESEDGEPTSPLIHSTMEFMLSPNPYYNNDEDPVDDPQPFESEGNVSPRNMSNFDEELK